MHEFTVVILHLNPHKIVLLAACWQGRKKKKKLTCCSFTPGVLLQESREGLQRNTAYSYVCTASTKAHTQTHSDGMTCKHSIKKQTIVDCFPNTEIVHSSSMSFCFTQKFLIPFLSYVCHFLHVTRSSQGLRFWPLTPWITPLMISLILCRKK